MKYTIPKGVYDLLPEPPEEEAWRSSHLWRWLEEIIHPLARSYGFYEIRTPIFEKTELFTRGVGETSDIVTKEMYTFEDKGERSMTLRPEGTAPAIRAFVEHHLDQLSPKQKFYYIGPMFRYERPQSGRYRQHTQFGVEAIGDPTPEQDVEIIDLLCTFYRKIGLSQLTVHLNSVGDSESREAFREALRAFLKPHYETLSPESQVRFEKNVLRILDSKDPNDQKILQGAPSLLDFLSSSSQDRFASVKTLLHRLGISYQVNAKLVRGLDYYNQTVFEITSGDLGAQNTLGGGGRYDGLISLLGGSPLSSIGFGTGLERVLQIALKQNIVTPPHFHPTLFIIPLGEKARVHAFDLLHHFRSQNVATEIEWHPKKLATTLQRAVKLRATYVLIIGEDELSSGLFTLKELKTHTEKKMSLKELDSLLIKNP